MPHLPYDGILIQLPRFVVYVFSVIFQKYHILFQGQVLQPVHQELIFSVALQVPLQLPRNVSDHQTIQSDSSDNILLLFQPALNYQLRTFLRPVRSSPDLADHTSYLSKLFFQIIAAPDTEKRALLLF